MNATARRIVFALAALVSALLPGCDHSASSRTADASTSKAAPLALRVAQVQSINIPRTQAVAGTLRPFDHAVLATKIMGTVTRVDFTVGQSVAAG
jgi:multidrug efflux pump subunit AcrA (membrane-fusion protein)